MYDLASLQLKELVLKHHPELLEVSGDDNKIRKAMIKAMIDV